MLLISVPDILIEARRLLHEMTGLETGEIIGVSHLDHSWHVRVEVVELTRIPSSADVVAEYEVIMSEDGHLEEFQRRRTRLRGDVIDGEVA